MVIEHSMTYPFSSSLKITLAALFIVAPVSSTFRHADDLLQGKVYYKLWGKYQLLKCVCMYYFLWAIILVSLALDADTDVVEDDQKYVKDNVNGVVYDSINASTHQQFVASKLHNQRTKRNAYGSSSRKDDDDSYRSNEVWKQLWPMDIEYRSNLVVHE